ncbi:ABC transporter permease [Streptomyces sp. sk2.1]|uniref:ABC transporter permease n=1 Tax=Streptomyces sp. sk2.1 TaxID=2478959 RepID=UPI00292A4313|nr:ABC transporter permease [Streptomyces sp. sk2.1]
MYDPTVARLTYRALLGRRRAAILFVLPALLLVIAGAVRMFAGADDQVASDVLGGFAIATMVPLIGVIAGTGAIGPEIDDGSIVYLLAKPVKRPTIICTKLIVSIAVTMVFSAVPTLIPSSGGGSSGSRRTPRAVPPRSPRCARRAVRPLRGCGRSDRGAGRARAAVSAGTEAATITPRRSLPAHPSPHSPTLVLRTGVGPLRGRRSEPLRGRLVPDGCRAYA